jgi:uncharacterized RDD family membrane protein YckC
MNAPSRRLLAFALDYVLIAIYLAVLALGSLVVLATPLRGAYAAVWANAWSAELAGFFLLTAPVIVYFALSESSREGATLGKQIAHLRVLGVDGRRLRVGSAFLRSAIKFLPWELAHFTIWHYVYRSGRNAAPPGWTTITLTAVYLIVAAYLVSLLVGKTHRTVYDRLAGSIVTATG